MNQMLVKDRIKFLIPLDGSTFSHQILPHVRQFADPDNAELILLRVTPAATGVSGSPPRTLVAEGWSLPMYESARDIEYAKHPIYSSQELDSLRARLTDEVRPVVRDLESAGYEVAVAIRFGEAAPEIVEFAAEEEVDVIAMATHGRTGLGRLLLGSVAEHVLRHAHVPVLLARPFERNSEAATAGEELATRLTGDRRVRVTVATDGSPFGHGAIALAGTLGRRLNAKLTILTTFDEERGATKGRDVLDEVWNLLGDVTPRPTSVPLVGSPEDVILRYVSDHPTDLLIVGAFADRTSTDPTALGRTAQRLIQSAPTSVLAVRDHRPGFEPLLACIALGDRTTPKVAALLADAVDAGLRLLHVIPPEATPYLTSSDEIVLSLDEILRQETSLSRYLKQVTYELETYGFDRDVLVVRRGVLPAALFEEVAAGAYDLLIIGSRCSPGHFPASAASHIVKHADCSVLIVR